MPEFSAPGLAALGDTLCRTFTPNALHGAEWAALDTSLVASLGLALDDLYSEATIAALGGGGTAHPAYACDYAGHQFGRFNPSLGDGRLALVGEWHTPAGSYEVSLKGAGRTAFSRHADGLAGISECLREFELGRQLVALEIPTALCLGVLRGTQQVYRKRFEHRAILVRLMPSHLRFGSFEALYAQRRYDVLGTLADFVIRNHYPSLQAHARPHAAWFEATVIATAELIARWQSVGFTHGMMNTDNQSVLGFTLDLGEAAFNESRDPEFVSAAEDEHRRYAFGDQPTIGLWNCNVLARALSPLIEADDLRNALRRYEPAYLAGPIV
ncbi:MAG: protein adenylyltransferase SelO family protein [Pseudomonadota bacterium]